MRVPVGSHPHHLMFSACNFSHSVDSGISLWFSFAVPINDVEHIFISLLTIQISLVKLKCLFLISFNLNVSPSISFFPSYLLKKCNKPLEVFHKLSFADGLSVMLNEHFSIVFGLFLN